MEININLAIQQLQQDIIQSLQGSNLPIGVIYYIIKDIYNLAYKEYQTAIQEAKINQLLPQQEENNKKDQEEE